MCSFSFFLFVIVLSNFWNWIIIIIIFHSLVFSGNFTRFFSYHSFFFVEGKHHPRSIAETQLKGFLQCHLLTNLLCKITIRNDFSVILLFPLNERSIAETAGRNSRNVRSLRNMLYILTINPVSWAQWLSRGQTWSTSTRRSWRHAPITSIRSTSATHCNRLQQTATDFNTLQHIATHCNTLQHTATTKPNTATN